MLRVRFCFHDTFRVICWNCREIDSLRRFVVAATRVRSVRESKSARRVRELHGSSVPNTGKTISLQKRSESRHAGLRNNCYDIVKKTKADSMSCFAPRQHPFEVSARQEPNPRVAYSRAM